MAWLTAAGYMMSATGSIVSGFAQEDNAESVGKQLRRRANARRAVAQREYAEIVEEGDLVVSRAEAELAMQGAAPGSAGAVKLISNLEAEKEYRAMASLWRGEEEALGMEREAAAAVSEGKAAKTAGWISGASTIMAFASDFYGDNKPKTRGRKSRGQKGSKYGISDNRKFSELSLNREYDY